MTTPGTREALEGLVSALRTIRRMAAKPMYAWETGDVIDALRAERVAAGRARSAGVGRRINPREADAMSDETCSGKFGCPCSKHFHPASPAPVCPTCGGSGSDAGRFPISGCRACNGAGRSPRAGTPPTALDKAQLIRDLQSAIHMVDDELIHGPDEPPHPRVVQFKAYQRRLRRHMDSLSEDATAADVDEFLGAEPPTPGERATGADMPDELRDWVVDETMGDKRCPNCARVGGHWFPCRKAAPLLAALVASLRRELAEERESSLAVFRLRDAAIRERDEARTALAAAREALKAADEAMTDAINDYVPCGCTGGVRPGRPETHGNCSTRDLLTAMRKVRAVLTPPSPPPGHPKETR